MDEMKFVAVLVGVEYSDMTYRIDTSMKELEGLANACNIECAASIIQKLNTIHPRTYVGSGKVDEIKDLVRQTDANLVIMNEELSPAQLMNLEAELGIEVCDRTYLILEILVNLYVLFENQKSMFTSPSCQMTDSAGCP